MFWNMASYLEAYSVRRYLIRFVRGKRICLHLRSTSQYMRIVFVFGSRRPYTIAMRFQLQHGLKITIFSQRERGMNVSPTKSAFLLFTGRHLPEFHLEMQGFVMMRFNTHPFLGIILDSSHIKKDTWTWSSCRSFVL